MKQLTCEMCGGVDLIKSDGYFVCQHCGTKYTVEEAKKMMIEGTVDVQGTVKVDNTDELKNLYEIARRARDDNNSENAQKYYDMILVKDPSSWEANFYTVYYQSMNCKIAGIQSAAIRVTNCEDTVFKLIRDNVSDPEEQKNAVDEVAAKLIKMAFALFNGAKNHYVGIDVSIRDKYKQEFLDRCCAARDIVYFAGDLIVKIFGDDLAKAISTHCWETGITLHKSLMFLFANKEVNKNTIESYAAKIKKYKPEYEAPVINTKSGGCYVATAVYGSYDCPEVWTLRRFRDFTLAETWYGRAFIKTYYAISPTLVEWFGHTEWFKKMWKSKLDRMVKNLQENGVEDTPYEDKNR